MAAPRNLVGLHHATQPHVGGGGGGYNGGRLVTCTVHLFCYSQLAIAALFRARFDRLQGGQMSAY